MAGRALGELGTDDVVVTIHESANPGLSHHTAEVARAAQRELDVLLRQRSEIVKKIGTVKQTLTGLASIFDLNGVVWNPSGAETLDSFSSHLTGLTDACRTALLQAGEPLRPSQVRDRLRFQGLSLDHHRDPVASVATILRRLGRYGEARTVVMPDGKRAWEWATTKGQNAVSEPD